MLKHLGAATNISPNGAVSLLEVQSDLNSSVSCS